MRARVNNNFSKRPHRYIYIYFVKIRAVYGNARLFVQRKIFRRPFRLVLSIRAKRSRTERRCSAIIVQSLSADGTKNTLNSSRRFDEPNALRGLAVLVNTSPTTKPLSETATPVVLARLLGLTEFEHVVYCARCWRTTTGPFERRLSSDFGAPVSFAIDESQFSYVRPARCVFLRSICKSLRNKLKTIKYLSWFVWLRNPCNKV